MDQVGVFHSIQKAMKIAVSCLFSFCSGRWTISPSKIPKISLMVNFMLSSDWIKEKSRISWFLVHLESCYHVRLTCVSEWTWWEDLACMWGTAIDWLGFCRDSMEMINWSWPAELGYTCLLPGCQLLVFRLQDWCFADRYWGLQPPTEVYALVPMSLNLDWALLGVSGAPAWQVICY